MIETYAINLKTSPQRRAYLSEIFAPYSDMLHLNIVEAVDGRSMSETALNSEFDQEMAYKLYGRKLQGGEVGCTLSHRKCLHKMLADGESTAVIVEDDLVWRDDNLPNTLSSVVGAFLRVNDDVPTLVLLSGDCWFTTSRPMGNKMISKVYEAVCSHAYMLNRKAAELIVALPKCHLADDWYFLRKAGVRIYALRPHVADQNRQTLKTEISDAYVGTIRKNLPLRRKINSYWRAVVKHALYYTGHFEFKDFGC